MAVLALALLVLITGLTTAYTRNFQNTVVLLCDRIAREAAGDLRQARAQSLGTLTPPTQAFRNVAVWLLFLLTLVCGWAFHSWQAALLCVGSGYLIAELASQLLPRPMASHYLRRIGEHVAVVREESRGKHDQPGVDAADYILKTIAFADSGHKPWDVEPPSGRARGR